MMLDKMIICTVLVLSSFKYDVISDKLIILSVPGQGCRMDQLAPSILLI